MLDVIGAPRTPIMNHTLVDIEWATFPQWPQDSGDGQDGADGGGLMKASCVSLALIAMGTAFHVRHAAGDESGCVDAALVSVVDCGATPNSTPPLDNDADDIQEAITHVHNFGGGRVVFPDGVYRAEATIDQLSNVELFGTASAQVVHATGTGHLIQGKTITTTGSTTQGSSTLNVASATGIDVGDRVAVLGARRDTTPVQRTQLQLPVTSIGGTFKLASIAGFDSTFTNYLLVENEIIRYQGINTTLMTLDNVARGRLGTTPATHGLVEIRQIETLYATVTSVVGTAVGLDTSAQFGVSGATVTVGSQNMKVTGLTLDGNRPSGGLASNPFPLLYRVANNVTVSGTVIRRGEHGAISLERGTTSSTIDGTTLYDTGDHDDNIGAAIWMFQAASGNTVKNNAIADETPNGSAHGVMIDDRSVTAQEWDGGSSGNTVQDNTITIGPTAGNGNWSVLVAGGTGNQITGNTVNGPEGGNATGFGIRVLTDTGQGQSPIPANYNTVTGNHLHKNPFSGLWVNSQNNTFRNNDLHNMPVPCTNTGGATNDFTGTTIDSVQVSC